MPYRYRKPKSKTPQTHPWLFLRPEQLKEAKEEAKQIRAKYDLIMKLEMTPMYDLVDANQYYSFHNMPKKTKDFGTSDFALVLMNKSFVIADMSKILRAVVMINMNGFDGTSPSVRSLNEFNNSVSSLYSFVIACFGSNESPSCPFFDASVFSIVK